MSWLKLISVGVIGILAGFYGGRLIDCRGEATLDNNDAPTSIESSSETIAVANQSIVIEAQPPVTSEPTPQPAPEPEEATLHLVRVVVEESAVRLCFSEQEWLRNCSKRTIEVSPSVEDLSVSPNWNGTVELEGDFKAETTYTVTVKAGVRTYDAFLKEDVTTTFYIGEPLKRTPQLNFLARGEYLPLSAATLPYEVMNVPEVTFTLYRAYENNLTPFGADPWEMRRIMTKVAEEKVTFKDVPRNVRVAQMVDVAALAKQKPGMYRLVAESEHHSESCHFTLTDLGIAYAYDANNGFFVAVHSIGTGTPVCGATIEVSSQKHQLLFRGTTDATGIAKLTFCPESPTTDEVPRSMIVRAKDDIAYVSWPGSLEKVPFTSRVMMWTDRGAVRPGESIRLHALVRSATLTALSDLPVTIRLENPRETELLNVALKTDAQGIVYADAMIPEGAVSGSYCARLFLGDQCLDTIGFYVADFVPDRMKVEVAFDGKEKVLVDARTYFNTDVAEATGDLRVTAEPLRCVDQWKEWLVGTDDAPTQTILSGAIKKPAGAKIEAAYELKAQSAPVRLSARATLAEPGGRSVTGMATDLRFTEAAYIGVRERKDVPEMTLLTLEESVAPMPVTVSLMRREWDYHVVRRGDTFCYEWEERTIEVDLPQRAFVLEKDKIIIVPMEAMERGRYTLTVKNSTGMTSAFSFWHSAGEAGERSENPSVLTFKTDKAKYQPGETATLTFTVPSDGTLLIEESSDVLYAMRSQTVTAGVCTVTTTLPPQLMSSEWNVGVTFVAKDVQRNGRLVGRAELEVDLFPKYGLHVAIDAAKVVRPQAKTDVTLKLTTHDGAPVEGEVVVMAVDEGVLALTDYLTPNPLAELCATHPRIWSSDIYAMLFPHLKIDKDGKIGGGMLMKNTAFASRDAIAMAEAEAERALEGEDAVDLADAVRVVLPPQKVSATGELTVSFNVPDLQGALRVMVVAAGDLHFGFGEYSMIVRPEATLLVSGVRYGCPGDEADMTATVTNCDLPEGDYTVTMGETTLTGTLAPGASATQKVRLPIGSKSIALMMDGKPIYRAELPVLVRPPVPQVKATTFALLPAGATVPEGAARVGSMAEVVAPSLDWLATYPYNCTEQLAARALPFVGSHNPAECALVVDLCQHLLARQLSDGGFGAWPGSDRTWTEGSLLAAQVLLVADRQQTFVLSPAVKKRILAYLQTVASNLSVDARGVAAYATWLLAEVQERAAVIAARNLLMTDKSDAAAFLAAVALVKVGFANEGVPILRTLLASETERKPALTGVMDGVAQRAMEVALATECGLQAELLTTTLAKFFTGERKTTQQNAWMALAVQALGEALPEGVLIRQTETVDVVRPGQPLTLKRVLRTIDGAEVTTLNHGDLAYVCITIDTPRRIEQVALRDLLPGGLEYEDAALATRDQSDLPKWATENVALFTPEYTQKMGSEVRWFGTLQKGLSTVVYPVRATTRGTFALPATIAEDMYDPVMTGATVSEGVLIIK